VNVFDIDGNIRPNPVIKGETKPSGNTAKLLDPPGEGVGTPHRTDDLAECMGDSARRVARRFRQPVLWLLTRCRNSWGALFVQVVARSMEAAVSVEEKRCISADISSRRMLVSPSAG
jgi:hypothetical protein